MGVIARLTGLVFLAGLLDLGCSGPSAPETDASVAQADGSLAGQIALTWSFFGCSPGFVVKLTSTVVGTSATFVDIFDCGAGSGTTYALPDGVYDVVVQGFDARNTPVTEAHPVMGVVIHGATVNLGNFSL